MQFHWHTEPFLLIGLLVPCWLYAMIIGPYRDRWYRGDSNILLWRAVSFYAGWAFFYIAVGSPIDQLGEDYLFFVHMIQHMLLIYIVPPLLIVGLPPQLVDQIPSQSFLAKALRVFFNPIFAGLTFSVVYTLWHIPLLYELALRDKPMHILEHATMFGLGFCMWWPVIGSSHKVLPKSGFGVRILYTFLLMVGQLPVFAFLCFSGNALYDTYVWAPRIIEGLDPLNDQILGGIIMKVSNMAVSLGTIAYCFYSWYLRDAAQEFGAAEQA